MPVLACWLGLFLIETSTLCADLAPSLCPSAHDDLETWCEASAERLSDAMTN